MRHTNRSHCTQFHHHAFIDSSKILMKDRVMRAIWQGFGSHYRPLKRVFVRGRSSIQTRLTCLCVHALHVSSRREPPPPSDSVFPRWTVMTRHVNSEALKQQEPRARPGPPRAARSRLHWRVDAAPTGARKNRRESHPLERRRKMV